MPATEAQTSGFDPIKKKQKKKNRFRFQRDLEEEDLSIPVESEKVRRHKENKGKQPDFTFGDDFVVSRKKKKDGLCCVAGPSLLGEKHGIPSTSNQYELDKNSLRCSISSGEVDRHRCKKRKTDVASLHNNSAAVKERIRTTELDSKVHVVPLEDNSSSTLQIDGNIESVIQKVEINEEITPSKKKRKRKKRQNELKDYANEERLEETVLWEQNHIYNNSPTKKKKKRKKRKNELKNYANEEPLEETVLCKQHHIDSNSISTDAKEKSHRPLKGIDTDAIIVKSKSVVVKNSTISLEDVRNGSMVEISAVNLVDKTLLDSAKRHSRRKKAVKIMDKSSKIHKVVSKCVEENMESPTICEQGQLSLTGKCVIDGSLSLDLVQASISLNKAPTGHTRRKLLILDLNGLLADIVRFQPYKKPDLKVARKSLFKRPFCDDFLKFCFERFNVGVWSSRTEDNTRTVVNFLMEDFKDRLLFCWHYFQFLQGQSKCTVTGFNTVENSHKPLFLKELRKLWDKEEPDLPWEKGDYTPANTLLLDDSPYKALRNPPFTAIFPRPYNFQDENDDTLGPGGDLRVYLEGITLADDIPHYVEQHPFGQHAITDTNPSWSYYLQIIGDKNSPLPSRQY